MARPIALRETASQLPEVDVRVPGLKVDVKTFWSPCQGLDYMNPKNRVDASHAVEMLNLWIDKGVLRSRYGSAQVGSAAGAPVMGVVNFVTGNGIGFIVRFLTTKMQLFNGTSWTDIPGATFTGGVSNFFAYTAFNDTLVFSNGVDGLWEYAPLVGSLTRITEGPNALHLTTFAGRVIATAVDGELSRMAWSARDNSRDWDGIGAGYEDLLSTPGGTVDQLMGVYPITDDIALMVRSGSIWQVTQTGDPDAPFRFGRLHAKIGSRSRHSITSIPGGICFMGVDDIYVITESDVKSIGMLVRDRFLLLNADVTKARGVYRPKLKEYWLTFGDDILYRYSFESQAWTRHQYTFNIRWMDETIFHYGGQTWDDTTGTFDSQTATWDSLLGTARSPAFYFATDESLGNIVAENPAASTDSYVQSGKSAKGIEIQTPILLAASPLEKTEVIECQLEYQAGDSQAIVVEYATDGGTVWSSYSTKTLAVASVPKISRCMPASLSRENFMFKIRSSALGTLKINSFSPFLVVEAKVAP